MVNRIKFQHCEVDFAQQKITRGTEVFHLPQDALQVLAFLVDKPDEVHCSTDIIDSALLTNKESEAEETGKSLEDLLANYIEQLCDAIGDSEISTNAIKSYPQQGYALIADFDIIETEGPTETTQSKPEDDSSVTNQNVAQDQQVIAQPPGKTPRQHQPLTSLGQLVKTPKFLSSNLNKAIFYIAFIVVIFMLLVLARSAREEQQETEVSAILQSTTSFHSPPQLHS